MFKQLVILVFLAAALLVASSPAHAVTRTDGALPSVSSPTHAATGTGTARSCAQAGITHIHSDGIDALNLVEYYYYSDATYTVQVGYRYIDQCNGDTYSTGTQTSYVIRKTKPCHCPLC